MSQLARKLEIPPVCQIWATVVQAGDDMYNLQAQEGTFTAKRASSCLLAPREGDRVLVTFRRPEESYILAVLERAAAGAAELTFDGDVRMHVKQGRLRITSQDGIDLASGGDISAVSQQVTLNTVKADVGVHALSYQGGSISASVGRLAWLADKVDALVERMTQRVKRLYRNVDEFEQVKAGRVDYLVKKLLSFRSEYTVVSAKEDVKVDGERIHIG